MKKRVSLEAAIALCNIGIIVMFGLWVHSTTVRANEVQATVTQMTAELAVKSKAAENRHKKNEEIY